MAEPRQVPAKGNTKADAIVRYVLPQSALTAIDSEEVADGATLAIGAVPRAELGSKTDANPSGIHPGT